MSVAYWGLILSWGKTPVWLFELWAKISQCFCKHCFIWKNDYQAKYGYIDLGALQTFLLKNK